MSWYQERLIYDGETDRLAEIVRAAANPQNEAFVPYRGRRIDEAVLFAKLMMRKARVLGLYDDAEYRAIAQVAERRKQGAA